MYPTYVHVMFICSLFFTCERVGFFDRATSLISDRDRDLDLHLKKEEWVSVLKLSTIWNMTCAARNAVKPMLDRQTLIYIFIEPDQAARD